jgi:hypothetical protein
MKTLHRHKPPEQPPKHSRVCAAVGSALPDPRLKLISFDDIRSQPDPDWSRPTADASREQAYRDADDAYLALHPSARTTVEENLTAIAATYPALPDCTPLLMRMAVDNAIAAILAEVTL